MVGNQETFEQKVVKHIRDFIVFLVVIGALAYPVYNFLDERGGKVDADMIIGTEEISVSSLKVFTAEVVMGKGSKVLMQLFHVDTDKGKFAAEYTKTFSSMWFNKEILYLVSTNSKGIHGINREFLCPGKIFTNSGCVESKPRLLDIEEYTKKN